MSKQDVLIVGSGAREHALAWKLRQSDRLGKLYVAPGNAGTAAIAENVAIGLKDVDALVRFVVERDVDLTIIGPEDPLALGLADRLLAAGKPVVGPTAAAARLESSKSFAKDLMARCQVPTSAYNLFDNPRDAFAHLTASWYPVVVKADGLAAGKGVSVCDDYGEAVKVIERLMVQQAFGPAGARVLIEEALHGPEVSLLALVDGETVVPLPVAQDHKRLGEGDTGPNTGGMGAYAPVPFIDVTERDALIDMIMKPILAQLAAEDAPYRGVLYAGLMLTADGPKVLEFNCRFGDPECQVIVPLIEGDLLPWLEALADGTLQGTMPIAQRQYSVGVVLATPGYPEAPQLGNPILGLDDVAPSTLVFHAGTKRNEAGEIVTAGGRVLTLVGVGGTPEEAFERSYEGPVSFEGMQRRADIAWQVRDPQHVKARQPVTVPALAPKRQRARIGVLASGDGSNLQAILDACRDGDLAADVVAVVSHRRRAKALDRARAAGAQAVALAFENRPDHTARRDYERQLLDVLMRFDLDVLVLAGWMLILSADFLNQCPFPVLNVHPALLPMNGADEPDPVIDLQEVRSGSARVPVLRGAHAVRDALALNLPYTGVSVHYVTPEVDAGPVLKREIVDIEPDDDEESLYRRIKPVEHRLLTEAVEAVLTTDVTGGVHA